MPMTFDDLAFRPGVTDDKSRDSPVNVHFFIDAMVGHEDQLLPVFLKLYRDLSNDARKCREILTSVVNNPGLLITSKQDCGYLKNCGTVSKEKGFAKRVLENACKNIPVNEM